MLKLKTHSVFHDLFLKQQYHINLFKDFINDVIIFKARVHFSRELKAVTHDEICIIRLVL